MCLKWNAIGEWKYFLLWQWTNEHTCAEGLMIKMKVMLGTSENQIPLYSSEHEVKLFARHISCMYLFRRCILRQWISHLTTTTYSALRGKKLCNLFTKFNAKIHSSAKVHHMYVFFGSNDVDLIEVKKLDRNVWNGKFCSRCDVTDPKRCIGEM